MNKDIFDEFEEFLEEKDKKEKCDVSCGILELILLALLLPRNQEQPTVNIYLGSEEDV